MKSTGLTAVFSLVLKVFAVASLIVGLGFIIFACLLQSPPKSFTPVYVASRFDAHDSRLAPCLQTS